MATVSYPKVNIRLVPDADPKLEVEGGDLPSLNIDLGLNFKLDPGKQVLSKPTED